MVLVIHTLLLPYIVINYAVSEICSSRILGDPQSPTGHSLELCWPCLEVGAWVGSPEAPASLSSTTTPHSGLIFWLFQVSLSSRGEATRKMSHPKAATNVSRALTLHQCDHHSVAPKTQTQPSAAYGHPNHVLGTFFKWNYFYSLIRKGRGYLQLAKTCLNKQQPQAPERSANSQSKITAAPSMCHINVGMLIVYL